MERATLRADWKRSEEETPTCASPHSTQSATNYPAGSTDHCLCQLIPKPALLKTVGGGFDNDSDNTPEPPEILDIRNSFTSTAGHILAASPWKSVAKVQVHKLVFFVHLALRALVLLLKSFPLLLLYPLTVISSHWASRWLDAQLWVTEPSGPTFIKLGQWASMRSDILFQDFCERLSRLHVDVHLHSWGHTKHTRFRENFKDVDFVKFPTPLRPFTRSLLVETFEESEPISNYLSPEVPLKVLVDNFVHGDLHPGNILVQRSSSGGDDDPEGRATLTDRWGTVLVSMRPAPAPLQLVLLDAGIVAQLSDRDLRNLRAVFTAMKEMAELVDHALSNSFSLGKVQVAELLSRVFGLVTHMVNLTGPGLRKSSFKTTNIFCNINNSHI
ncbi:unnamed protein product [Coregonus sp. 'balchen']|nr:unnamed protein product [Coregonus sp. 'balchen']